MSVSIVKTPPGIARSLLALSRPGRDKTLTSLLILDRQGMIVHGNPEWFRLAEALQLTGASYRIGGDYLAACLSGWGIGIPEIISHGVNMAAIMQGGGQEGAVIYTSRIAGERRWFRVAALPLQGTADDGILVLHSEITADIRHEETLARQAFFDALTDLPNYALFNDRLNHAIAQSSRSNEPLATMFIDVDDFKSINDTYGHLSGNDVLADVARRLSACLREGDTVARLGGDEFGMLLPGIGTCEAAGHVAQKILHALAPPFATHDGRTLRLTASVGIAFFPKDGLSLDTLMHGADQAMYRSKNVCKNALRSSTFGFCEPRHVFNDPIIKTGKFTTEGRSPSMD